MNRPRAPGNVHQCGLAVKIANLFAIWARDALKIRRLAPPSLPLEPHRRRRAKLVRAFGRRQSSAGARDPRRPGARQHEFTCARARRDFRHQVTKRLGVRARSRPRSRDWKLGARAPKRAINMGQLCGFNWISCKSWAHQLGPRRARQLTRSARSISSSRPPVRWS